MPTERDVRQERRASVVEVFKRISATQYDAAAELMTEGFRFELPYSAPKVPASLNSRAEWLETTKRVLGEFGPMNLAITEVHEMLDADQLIAEYTSDTSYLPTRRPYKNRYIGYFVFSEDRLDFWREFHNPEILSEAMRPSE